ncbi:MAG: PSP1 domain-containing protein [bacterium]
MRRVVTVEFEDGFTSECDAQNCDLNVGDLCVVEADHNTLEIARALTGVIEVQDRILKAPLKRVIRKATSDDIQKMRENEEKEKHAHKICKQKILYYDLRMKLVKTKYSFGSNYITFYYVADHRVDFRELVKDLSRTLGCRIKMQQIGVRDQAQLLGGYGICGRPTCCSSFLRHFESITLRYAKDQNLPLNPSKISGLCGRLFCCLGYEEKTYADLLKKFPKEGVAVTFKNQEGEVVKLNVLQGTVGILIKGDDGKEEKYVEVPVEDLKVKKFIFSII